MASSGEQQSVPPSTAASAQTTQLTDAPLAGRVRRLIATLIDMLLVPLTAVFLVLVTGATEDAEDYANIPGMGLHILALAILGYLLINGYSLWRHGQTLGKKLLGISIVHTQNRTPLAMWRLVCIRALFFPTLFLLLLLPSSPLLSIPWLAGLIPVVDQLFIFGKDKRTLHDYAANSVVVRK